VKTEPDPRRRKTLQAAAAAWAGTAWPALAAVQTPRAWERWQAGRWCGFTTDNLPRMNRITLRALHGAGARLARVGMPFRPCEGQASCAQACSCTQDLSLAGALLDEAQSLGMGLVMLGLFDGPGREAALWSESRQQSAFVQAWADFGRQLGRHPALAGMDLLNEPQPPLPQGRLAPAQQLWGALALKAIRALRQAGASAPVVFEPVAGGSTLGFKNMPALPVGGVVYSLHFYTPHDITHQQVSPTWPRRIPYPAGSEHGLGAWDPELGVGSIDKARLEAELRPVRDFQQRHACPVYVGEFGCVRWAPDGSALRWVQDCLLLFQQAGWSWTFHSFRTWPGWDAEIDSESVDARARTDQAPVMQALRTAMAPAVSAARKRP